MPNQKLQNDSIDHYKLEMLKDSFQQEVSRNIQGFKRGFIVYEQSPGKVKISARGNNLSNKINLPEMLMKLGGNGGGHFNACRVDLEGNFEEIKKKLIELIQKSSFGQAKKES